MSDPREMTTPPYVAYTTFKNVTQTLALDGTIPSHVDHSVLSSVGGSTRKQYLTALKFLDLVGPDCVPNEGLRKLMTANESDWQDYMQSLLQEKYGSLLDRLEDGTQKSFREAFLSEFEGIGSSLVDSAIRFLIAAARDVGIKVSSHLVQRKPKFGRAPRRRTSKTPKQAITPDAPATSPQPESSFLEALLKKFPDFDPSWPDEHKSAWFEAFGRFMEMTKTKDASRNAPTGE